MKFILIPILLISLLLASCSGQGANQPLPTVILGGGTPGPSATQSASTSRGGGITASGEVVPARDAQMAFPLPGIVSKVLVAAGDQVKAGDLLVELDNSAAQLQVDAAQRAVRELTSPAAIAAAEQAVVDAQKAQDDAQKQVQRYKYVRASLEQIDNAKASLALAQDKMDEAFDQYQKYKNYPPDNPKRAQAYTTYYAARLARDNAQRNLNWLVGGPSESDVSAANADLDVAEAALQEAQWYLSELKGETVPPEATGAMLTQLQQARDTLKSAQDSLAKTRLLAPISGTVTTVNIVPGEYVLPGQALVGITDVADLQVETSDLSELDVPQVQVGQPVSVQVKALNTDIPGKVISISPVATTLGGDVVYKTTIGLDNIPEGLRAGMSVVVNYLP